MVCPPPSRESGPQARALSKREDGRTRIRGPTPYATNLSLDSHGRIVRSDPLNSGGEFRVQGIPIYLNGVTLPPAAEVAVEFASRHTGVKVSNVPVVGLPGNWVVQTQARWQLVMARSVAFERVVDGQRAAYLALRDLAEEITDGRWVATGGGGYALVEVVPRIVEVYELFGSERLRLVPSGNDSPLIDLRYVSQQLADAALGAG
jgi:hypothetical protein